MISYNNRLLSTGIILSGYGAIYNGFAVDESANNNGFINGFTVPTDTQWGSLIGVTSGNAGWKLKSTRTSPDIEPRWQTGNTLATDEFNLSLLPGGYRTDFFPTFSGVNIIGFWWSSSESTSSSYLWNRSAYFDSPDITRNDGHKNYGFSIRCVRNLTIEEQSLNNGTLLTSVKDYNNNWYQVVKIGNLAWTAQNLRASNYANGTVIPNITVGNDWQNLTTGGYCWYENDINTSGIVYTDEFIKKIVTI